MKLIRDHAADEVGAENTRIVADQMRMPLMVAKLAEVSARIVSSTESMDDYADLLQIVEDLAIERGCDWNGLLRVYEQRQQRLGGYRRGIAAVRR